MIVGIEDYWRALIQAARNAGLKPTPLAKLAGLNSRTLKNAISDSTRMERGANNPTLATIRAVERALGRYGLWESKILINDPVISRNRIQGPRSANAKALLPPRMLRFIDVRVAEARRYLEHLENQRGYLISSDVDTSVVARIAPGTKCHVVDVSTTLEQASFARWNWIEDYQKGQDLTGMVIRDDLDSALAQCFSDDISQVTVSGMPQLAVIDRKIAWDRSGPSHRVVVRWMRACVGPGDRSQVIVLARLQKSDPAIKTVQSLIFAHEHEC